MKKFHGSDEKSKFFIIEYMPFTTETCLKRNFYKGHCDSVFTVCDFKIYLSAKKYWFLWRRFLLTVLFNSYFLVFNIFLNIGNHENLRLRIKAFHIYFKHSSWYHHNIFHSYLGIQSSSWSYPLVLSSYPGQNKLTSL